MQVLITLTAVDDIRPRRHQNICSHLLRMTLTSSASIWKYATSIEDSAVGRIVRCAIWARDIPLWLWEGNPRPLAAQSIVSRMIGRCKSRHSSVGRYGINILEGMRRQWLWLWRRWDYYLCHHCLHFYCGVHSS